MTTPVGTISMSDVNVELSKASSALITLNDGEVRNLAGVPSGTISMNDLRGKSAVNYGALTPSHTVRAEGQTFTFTLSGGTAVPNGTYYWRVEYGSNLTSADFSAVTGSFAVSSNTGSFTVTTINDALDEGDGDFRVVIGDASGVPTVYVTSPYVTVTETVAYTITAASTSVYRIGTSWDDRLASCSIQTENLPPGVTFYWDIQNITGTVTTADISATSGSVTTNALFFATASIEAVEITNGAAVASKQFRVRFYKDAAKTQLVGTSPTITLRAAPTYSLSFSPTSFAEGKTASWTLVTTNIPYPYTLYYSWSFGSGATSSDVVGGATQGSMSITSGSMSGTFTPAYDSSTESNEVFTLNVRAGSTSGTVLTSASVTATQALGVVSLLQLYASGGSSPNSAVTITLRILSIDSYPLSRTFSIQYSLNGGAWTTTDLAATSITVNANATSSSLITIYNTPGGALVSSLKARVSLTGHTTKESNTVAGFYI